MSLSQVDFAKKWQDKLVRNANEVSPWYYDHSRLCLRYGAPLNLVLDENKSIQNWIMQQQQELEIINPWQNLIRKYIETQKLRKVEHIDGFTWLSDHFVCYGRQPGTVTYSKDETMVRKERRSVSSIQYYLSRYYKDQAPPGSELYYKICKLVEERTTIPVLFATTPDEIERVYTNFDPHSIQIANSCMRYNANHWPSKSHPCRVYGAGDLAIAYLEDEYGRTTHRALCWPDKKIYSRMYGNDAKLHDALKSLGYKKSRYYSDENSDENQSMYGALLLRKSHDDYFIMPYIDEPCGIRRHKGGFIMCSVDSEDEDIYTQSTKGISITDDEWEREYGDDRYEDEEDDPDRYNGDNGDDD